jgi:hypothetical protein
MEFGKDEKAAISRQARPLVEMAGRLKARFRMSRRMATMCGPASKGAGPLYLRTLGSATLRHHRGG